MKIEDQPQDVSMQAESEKTRDIAPTEYLVELHLRRL
jgi:hypothetical protein